MPSIICVLHESAPPVEQVVWVRPLKGAIFTIFFSDRINRIFRIFVSTLSGRKSGRTIPLAREKKTRTYYVTPWFILSLEEE